MNLKHPLILASSSPRRQFLLSELGFRFTITTPGTDELFPPDMPVEHVPRYLALEKAKAVAPRLKDEIVITSDTIVILENKILNKPGDREEAIEMLGRLSGNTHQVITAVCLMSRAKTDQFEDQTAVTFNSLARREIETYVDECRPYDKAGAYGAQECLPAGVNPCSPEEIAFLTQIGKRDLIAKSISAEKPRLVAIDRIAGSYFTVMGMPIHKVYAHLEAF